MPLFATFKYSITAGGSTQTYYFRGQQDTYPPTVAAALGVTLAPDAEKNRPRTKNEELVAKGVMIRLVASTTVSGGTKTKNVKLLCGRDRLSNALDNLGGMQIRNNAITSVRIPQKATFF